MTEKRGKGRPKKHIDWLTFEKLCEIQCTPEECASVLRISRRQLLERAPQQYKQPDFPSVYKLFADQGKASLRRMQWRIAEKHAGMAIWLGKQYLGQTDQAIVMPVSNEVLNNFEKLMTQIKQSQKDFIASRSDESSAATSSMVDAKSA